MAKRGGSHHSKRLTVPNAVPVIGRKSIRWMLTPRPGPHPKERALTLGSLLRDVLKFGVDAREVKKAIKAGAIKVDGKISRDERRPVGLMDLIEIPKVGKTWRMQIGADGKLAAKEISADAARSKLVKVVGKHTIKSGKTQVALHDGRTLLADNAVKVGSTLCVSVPALKIEKSLPLESGVHCLITSGKHAGEIATLEKIIERVGSMDSEASLKSGNESFITVTKYLFVVDREFA